MNTDQLAEAKLRLPLPALMTLLGHGEAAKKSARCRFHDDSHESFSMYRRVDGSYAWKCHASCGGGDELDFLARARNLSPAEAYREFIRLAGVSRTPDSGDAAARRIVATYDYRDQAGALLYQVVRFEPKTFRQRRPDSAAPDGWTWKLDGVRRVLYRLPEVLAAVGRGETIIVAEGEKDVAGLVDHGFPATCNAGGAGKWLDDYTATLRGADVVIVADKDAAGRNHAQLVARKLVGHSKTVRVVELPDFNGCQVKDAHDFFAAGATSDDFRTAIASVPPVTAAESKHLDDPSNTSIVLAESEDEALPDPFPVDALPPALAGIINAVARCERVPLALPAVCALGVTSAALGAGLEALSGADRVTRGNLFLLADAESGSGKSEACRHIVVPLTEHQAALLEAWRKTAADNQAEMTRLETQKKAIEKKMAKLMRSQFPDQDELKRLEAELAQPLARLQELREITAPCILADDVTIEALAIRLRDNHEVMFCFSSDARKPVQNLMGRYNPGKTTDDSLYLKAFSGEFSRVDRTKGDPIVLRKPCLTLCWFIQPDLLAAMLNEDSLSASGFMPRLLVCKTHAAPRRIEGEIQRMSETVRTQWRALIAALLTAFHAAPKPWRIEPTPEAKRLLDDFHNSIVDRRQADLADVGVFAARYAEQAWRMAVVLHAALHGANAANWPLDLETAQNAIRIIEWFINQQLNILAKGRTATARKLEDEVLQLLDDRAHGKRLSPKERKLGGPFEFVTARIVYRNGIVGSAEAAHPLLASMEAQGLVVGQDVRPAHGGKTTRIYRAINESNPVPE